MAASDISGDFGFATQFTCILKEGNITVGTGFDFMGSTTGTVSLASGLKQGDWVALSPDSANTYSATGGLPVVTALAADTDLFFGRIIETPRWVKIPSTSQTTWSTMLSSGYYRVATVEFFPMMVVTANITAAGSNIIPGTKSELDVDASETDGTKGLTVLYVAASAGSADIIPLTYVGSGNTESVLVGIKGLGTVG